jgi:hypothetical protein
VVNAFAAVYEFSHVTICFWNQGRCGLIFHGSLLILKCVSGVDAGLTQLVPV